MNLYEESDYGIISLLIGICSIGTIFWWYISIPCALLTILLAFLAKDANSKITCIAGLSIGGLSLLMSVLVLISTYTMSINNMLDEVNIDSLNDKITLNRNK